MSVTRFGLQIPSFTHSHERIRSMIDARAELVLTP